MNYDKRARENVITYTKVVSSQALFNRLLQGVPTKQEYV